MTFNHAEVYRAEMRAYSARRREMQINALAKAAGGAIALSFAAYVFAETVIGFFTTQY